MRLLSRFIGFFLLFLTSSMYGQDSLTVMFYNLTNYGVQINGCNSTNNGIVNKNADLKTITKFIMPDIFGVCELGKNPIYATGILNNALNTDGVTKYAMVPWVNDQPGTDIVTHLYYNTEKIGFKRLNAIQTNYRYSKQYQLFYKDANLTSGSDTVFINPVTTHLKAGTNASDLTDRGTMSNTIINFLKSQNFKSNHIIMGDFNVYRSTEQAWTNFTNATNGNFRFQDPINRVGSWTLNAQFANVHTQCPRTDNNSGCFSGGGMDDRFDFILMNDYLINDSAGMKYITGSYKAVGNDGLHFNKSITDSPQNSSVPSNVLSALFRMSDHLPVMAKVRVKTLITPISSYARQSKKWSIWKNASQELVIECEDKAESVNHVSLLSLDGKLVEKELFNLNNEMGMHVFQLKSIPSGIYLVRFKDSRQQTNYLRFIKN